MSLIKQDILQSLDPYTPAISRLHIEGDQETVNNQCTYILPVFHC